MAETFTGRNLKMREIIRFGRHDATHGHIIERKKCGFPSKYRNKRLKVKIVHGQWFDENGVNVNDEITAQLIKQQMRRIGAL